MTTDRQSPPPDDFHQLLEAARHHQPEAISALYSRTLPAVYRYVQLHLGRSEQIEDVVSEVFLEMVEKIGNVRAEQESSFFAWLLKVAQGKVSARLKSITRVERRTVSLPLSVEHSEDNGYHLPEPAALDRESNPEEFHEHREMVDELREAFKELTEEQRQVVVGRFISGQSIGELAEEMKREEGAIRALQFRALKALAKFFGRNRSRTTRLLSPMGERERRMRPKGKR